MDDPNATRPLSTPSEHPTAVAAQATVVNVDATIVDASTSVSGTMTGGGIPTIEGYVIRHCLGQGGMGAVYEGIQQSTGRRVAIKLMLDSALGSEEGRKRFEREVDVVARLEHPAVVAVIDSGVRKGKYYYVMEYVEGRSLDHVLAPGTCDVKRTLELIAEVCDAVDYAHQRGVLHRDLKPGNILVDTRGHIRLLDFGIAQVLSDDPGGSRETLSRPGQIVGTLAYMSPEQAAGNAAESSIRTDVYALGAIAYDLLTGTLPCSMEGALVNALKNIAEVDPVRPSSIRKGLPRDVDAMLLKALEKHPDKRYGSARELAADMRRFLAGEPVLARPVGLTGRAWRWANRNRTITAVGAASLLTLAAVSTGLILRIVEEKERATENWTRFSKLLLSTNPEKEKGGGTILQLIQRVASDLDTSPPKSDESEADIREILSPLLRSFQMYDKAITNERRVLEVRESHARGDDPKIAKALHNLAATLWFDSQFQESEKLYTRELEMLQRLHPKDNADTASAMTGLAGCRLKLGRVESARTLYRNVLEMRRRMYGPEHEDVAAALNNLARCDMEVEAFETAEDAFRTALAMVTKFKGETYLNTAAAATNLADCLLKRNDAERLDGDSAHTLARAAQARDLYQSAYDLRMKKYPEGHQSAASSLAGKARALIALGDGKEANDCAASGIEIMKRLNTGPNSTLAELLAIAGQVELEAGGSTAARIHFEQAIDAMTKSKQVNAVRLAELRCQLGEAMVRAGETEPGLTLMRENAASIARARGEKSLPARMAQQRLRAAELTPAPR